MRRGGRKLEYFIILDNGDAIRVRRTIERGRVLDFTVQYEPYVEGKFRPAERYDSAHGQAHRDTLDWDGQEVAKTWLPRDMDLNEAFTYADNHH